MRGRAHGSETQAKVLVAFLTGETVTQAAAAGDVSRATAREWWRAFRKTDDYREICRMVMGQFATKKAGDATDAPLFNFAAVRDTRYTIRISR